MKPIAILAAGLLALAPPLAASAQEAGEAFMEAERIVEGLYYPITGEIPPSLDLEVLFVFDSAELTPQAEKQLAALADALASPKLQGAAYAIRGHTDAVGGAQYNLGLSRRRAHAVFDFLVQRRDVAHMIERVEGVGEAELKYPQAPAAARNRRVEILGVRPAPGSADDSGGYAITE